MEVMHNREIELNFACNLAQSCARLTADYEYSKKDKTVRKH